MPIGWFLWMTKSIISTQGHICPINTHTINRVHYVHSYTPKYTCTEETQIINDDCGGCGMMR